MKKKIIIFSILIICISILCISKLFFKKIVFDIDNDGIPDYFSYEKLGSKYKDVILTPYSEYLKEINIFWYDDGNISKIIYKKKKNLNNEKDFIIFYQKGKYVEKQDENLLRQELDFKKTYPKGGPKTGVSYIYTKNKNIILKENDSNKDGIIDEKAHFANNKIIKIEADTNHDGIFDYWQYLDIKGSAYRMEKDTNGDGIPDEVKTY